MISRQDMGGANAEIGFSHQDCAEIYATFKVLENSQFVKLTVEHKNDYELVFRDRVESVQVKSYQVNLTTMGEYVRNAPAGKTHYIILADSYDEKARKFINRFRTFCANPDDLPQYRDEVCSKLGLNGNTELLYTAMRFSFETFQQGNNFELALIQIMQWASRTGRQCDAIGVAKSLKPLLSEQRQLRGSLNKEKIVKVADDNRVVHTYEARRVFSEEDGEQFSADLLAYIDGFIADQAHHAAMTNDLKMLKLLLENKSIDAITKANDIATQNDNYQWLAAGVNEIMGESFDYKNIQRRPQGPFEELIRAICSVADQQWKIARNQLASLAENVLLQTNVYALLGFANFEIGYYDDAVLNFRSAMNASESPKVISKLYCELYRCEAQRHPNNPDISYLDYAEQLDPESNAAKLLKIAHYDATGNYRSILQVYNKINMGDLTDKKMNEIYPIILVSEVQCEDSRLRTDIIDFLKVIGRLKLVQDGGNICYFYVGLRFSMFIVVERTGNILSTTVGQEQVSIDFSEIIEDGVGVRVPPTEAWQQALVGHTAQRILQSEDRILTHDEISSMTSRIEFQEFYGLPAIYVSADERGIDSIKSTNGIIANHSWEYMNKPAEKLDAEINLYLYPQRVSVYLRIGRFAITIKLDKIGLPTRQFIKKFRASEITDVVIWIKTPRDKEDFIVWIPKDQCKLQEK